MLSVRAHAIISAVLLAAMIAFSAAGSALAASGIVRDPSPFRIPVLILFFALFIAFTFSLVPLMVKAVLGFQKAVGNQNVPPIKQAIASQTLIIWIIWGLMAAGMAVAIPAAIADGFFGSELAASAFTSRTSQGVLVATPGMTVDEIARASTLALDLAGRKPPITTIASEGWFDFQVPGSGVRFSHCRYYYMSTAT